MREEFQSHHIPFTLSQYMHATITSTSMLLGTICMHTYIALSQERVDAASIPGLYSWLGLGSAHVTLRSIMG
jgi:hypothetical protein